MNEFNEVTAANLRYVRGSRGMSQDEVAEVLGLKGYHISKIEKGKRELSPAEASLLNLFFFDRMPFEIVSEKLLDSVLSFTEHQWRVICILAKRQGLSPGAWIAAQIRAYLAMDDEAKIERDRLEASHKASDAGVTHLQEVIKVAEDPAPYGSQKGKA